MSIGRKLINIFEKCKNNPEAGFEELFFRQFGK
jgi:hypothetical protein